VRVKGWPGFSGARGPTGHSTPTGGSNIVSVSVAFNKREAQRCLDSRLGDIAQGKFNLSKLDRSPKLDEFSEEYLGWARIHKRSWKRDVTSLNQLLPVLGNLKLSGITPELVERYKAKRQQSVCNGTVNRELACLKHMLNLAVKWGKLQSNPIRDVSMLREPKVHVRYLTEVEAKKLIEACSETLRPIVITALNTGMRLSEILNLKWSEVDFDRGVFVIKQSKNGEPREVPLNQEMLCLLENLPLKGEHVFTNRRGEPYTHIEKVFATARRKAGIKDFRFHDLRHTWASWLVMRGIDLYTLQQIGGWKSFSMVQRYAHLSPEHMRKAVSALDKLRLWSEAEARTIARTAKNKAAKAVD